MAFPSRRRAHCGVAMLCWLAAAAQSAGGQSVPASPKAPKAANSPTGDAQWIWSPQHKAGQAPLGACFFRRSFQLQAPEVGKIMVACDDGYELFVNGRPVGSGRDWKSPNAFDISRHLAPGRNTIAVKAENREGGVAGLVARITVQQAGQTADSYSTDARWKCSLQAGPNWQKPGFNDAAWLPAVALGEFGKTPQWAQPAASDAAGAGRFQIDPSFRVERVAAPALSGSLIAFAFNEWGNIVASQEAGPLLVLKDKDLDGVSETAVVYSDKLKNCQGLLALNGQIYAVGEGPDGTALYRLDDRDRDDKADVVETLVRFGKPMGEHGPHALALGPDGMIYILLGNASSLPEKIADSSPYRRYYEGDLVQPRIEDPAGFVAPTKAPGGAVLRTDVDGQTLELFAGGIRNSYDMAFDRQGELFTADSDNETDEGLPWFRPTRITHVPAGAEFGWRSGWASWPDYYLDATPPVLYTGRGSPSGLEFYDHHRYPDSFRNALFIGDWSRGRIAVVKFEPAEGTYRAESETFLEGHPLNVTDLAVGRDGCLYFATGGRGTEGGVYRVAYDGPAPPPRRDGLAQALRQPQFYSAWGREQAAIAKDELGGQWDKQIAAVVASPTASAEERVRALDLMQLVGPFPTGALLVKAASAPEATVRAKAAYMMGLHADAGAAKRLVELMSDPDPAVRRIACESLARSGYVPSWERLSPVLADPTRAVAFAARRLLMEIPKEKWQAAALAHPQTAVFLHASAALCALEPDRGTTAAILQRSTRLMRGYLSDEEFLSLLRVMQLALLANEPSELESLMVRKQLSEEYPALEPRLNRELVRLLAHLQDPHIVQRLMEELQGSAPQAEKLHAALHAAYLKDGWTSSQKLDMLAYFEEARASRGGPGLAKYMDAAAREFFTLLAPAEQRAALAEATRFPSVALHALVALPERLDAETLDQLEALDAAMSRVEGDAARQFGVAIVAIAARSGEPRAFAFLRKIYDADPDRRATVAMGLAQQPSGENWPYLVRALNVLEGEAAREVLGKLAGAVERPSEPEPLRQAILCGLKLKDDKLKDDGAQLAVALLEKWTQESVGSPDDKPAERLAAWQAWFRNRHPAHADPSLPVEAAESKWTLDELTAFLNGPEGKQGRTENGQLVFERALCAKCHRHGNLGEPAGPDLTTVTRRFQKREILEAVLFPSHVVSDQYASKTVVTKDGLTLSGLVGSPGRGAVTVLEPSGKKTTVQEKDIEEISPLKKSAMPEGLFNNLTLEEIADLMAFLASEPSHVAERPLRSRLK